MTPQELESLQVAYLEACQKRDAWRQLAANTRTAFGVAAAMLGDACAEMTSAAESKRLSPRDTASMQTLVKQINGFMNELHVDTPAIIADEARESDGEQQ